MWKTAVNDWKHHTHNEFICFRIQRRKSVEDKTITAYLKFDFARANRQLMECGTKCLHLRDGDILVIPKNRRTIICTIFYIDYCKNKASNTGVKGICRTFFSGCLR